MRSRPIPRRTPLTADPESIRAWRERTRTPLPKRNEKRARERKGAGDVYGDYHAFVGTLPCILAPHHRCWPPVKGHHLKRVGSGGQDEGNEVPACIRAHDELHWSERDVEARYGLDLMAIAAAVQRRWREERGHE